MDENRPYTVVPEPLRAFLRDLNDPDADTIWVWLDTHPYVRLHMIQEIANSHEELQLQLTGKIER